ncbi:hypothetical protein Tco_1420464 [Tanacetum coccineum]
MLMPRSLRAYYLPFMDSEMLRIDLIINPQETQQVIARDEKWVPSTKRVKISPTNVRLETIQFWYTIKKVKDSESYEFILANKKYVVDAEVFRKILNICPRVKGEEFTEVQDDDDTLTFLIDLGYKGPLHKHTNMFVDHMHQPWRTLAAIISKENVDYPELIWEDFAFQINHMKEKRSRRETMLFLRFTKSYHQSLLLTTLVSLQAKEYELPIPETMLNDKIKQSESYKMFIKYSTSQIPPKKSRGKISQGKKTTDTTKESDAKPASQQTASRRMVKKQVTITAADNIIPDLDVALELDKSISLTEAEETEAARQVHATYARIVTEPIPESAKKKTGSRRTSRILVVPDEPTVVSTTSNEGTGTKPVVPDEKKVSSKANVILDDDEYVHGEEHVQDDDEETDDEFVHGDDQVNDDEDEEMTNAEVEEFGFGDEEIADTAKADAEKTEVVKDDAKKAELPLTSSSLYVSSGFGDQFLKLSSDSFLVGNVKDTTDAEINSLLDVKIQSEVPHIQSSSIFIVHVSVISEPLVLTPIPETPSVALTITLQPPLSVSTTIPTMQQATTPILTPPIITEALSITIVIPESDALTVVQLRIAKLEQDVFELKKIDHSVEALATLKSQVPMVVGNYIGSKLGDDLQKVLQRHIADLIQKYSVKPAPESSKTWTPIVDLDQESEKSPLEILMIKKEQAEKQKMPKNPANHALYQALMEALIEVEKAMDKGVDDLVKNHKRQHDGDDDDDDEDPSAGPNQGKVLSKSSKTGKSTTTKEPVEEPIAEVIMDYTVNTAGEDVVHDDDQPQDTSKLKKDKTLTQDWFKQPPRPPTPDPE